MTRPREGQGSELWRPNTALPNLPRCPVLRAQLVELLVGARDVEVGGDVVDVGILRDGEHGQLHRDELPLSAEALGARLGPIERGIARGYELVVDRGDGAADVPDGARLLQPQRADHRVLAPFVFRVVRVLREDGRIECLLDKVPDAIARADTL
eukprot:scaffold10435_cov60-Phaeocystis_antarctica.AAC.3